MWDSVSRYGVKEDLKNHRALLSAVEMPAAEKKAILDEIDRIAAMVDEGKGPPLLKWFDHHDVIKPAVTDGKVTAEDRKLVKRELDKVEAEQKAR